MADLYNTLGHVPAPPLQSLLTDTLSGRPRSRSEWEEAFARWQRPASESEEAKIDAAATRIAKALEKCSFLTNRPWGVIKQGSYHNNTNVRLDSDIDLAVCLKDTFHFDGPAHDQPSPAELGLIPLTFTFDDFKSQVAWCLHEEFGHGAVNIGNKAIQINKGLEGRAKADVVPVFTYRRYEARPGLLGIRPEPLTGVALQTPDGAWHTSFPEQHNENGCAKTEQTGRRYKRVVRILKRLRNHISANQYASASMRNCAESTPSFLIECLVYNCPGYCFGGAAFYDDVLAVLNFLKAGLRCQNSASTILRMPTWMPWCEVNGIKPLFSHEHPQRHDEAATFVNCAHLYVTA